jgi:hypothetical protein
VTASLVVAKDDDDARAIMFARHRNDQHCASTTVFDRGRWLWRPASQLAEDLKHSNEKLKKLYVRTLEGNPITDVFSRLEPKVVAVARGANVT